MQGVLDGFYIRAYQLIATERNLDFSFKRCESDGGSLFDGYIRQQTWQSPSKLDIEIVIPSNCGDFFWFGKVKRDENVLRLQYTQLSKGKYACGACPVVLRYEIDALSQTKEYLIEIEQY